MQQIGEEGSLPVLKLKHAMLVIGGSSLLNKNLGITSKFSNVYYFRDFIQDQVIFLSILLLCIFSKQKSLSFGVYVVYSGELCQNQRFQKREYPEAVPIKCEGKGWGLKSLVDIKRVG